MELACQTVEVREEGKLRNACSLQKLACAIARRGWDVDLRNRLWMEYVERRLKIIV